MTRPRLIVFLMIEGSYVRKSISFLDSRYIGDPLNAVKIFSDFKVDELILIDISATREEREPDYDLLENIASVSRMPLCYGGGINSLHQIEKIINIGFEKVSISTEAINNPQLLLDSSSVFGSQSIVGCLDIRYSDNMGYEVFTNNGTRNSTINLLDSIKFLVDNGVGEILVNNISLDGTYKGMDNDLIKEAMEYSDVPVTFVGGLSSFDEIKMISKKFRPSGIAAGSLWCFKGKHGPVLLNYPDKNEKMKLFASEKIEKLR
jgi:imidazole glycerol-phosphate synthase subunit HisF